MLIHQAARLCLALAALLLVSAPARAADQQWLKAVTPNFELYTTAGEKRARAALLRFEQIRGFFLGAIGVEGESTQPVRIIGFRNQKEFEPYSINEFATAYYVGGYDRDYIVMSRIGSGHYETAVHEYVHLLVRHSGLKLPPWLNEGLADLYSTLRPSGKKVLVGEILPGRVQVLQQRIWLPLAELVAVGRDSPHYNEKKRAGVFYAQSWALTHMLFFSREYQRKTPELVRAIADGADPVASFERIYKRPLKRITTDLHNYLEKERLFAALYDVRLEKSALEPVVAPAPEPEAELVLAHLLSRTKGKRRQAREKYLDLAQRFPEEARVPEALGYLALYEKKRDEAADYFVRAADLGSANPKMYYTLSGLRRDDRASRIEWLGKAVELKPDYNAALRSLGFVLLDDKQYIPAIRTLMRIKNVKTKREAYDIYSGQAYAYYGIHRLEDARKAAELAKKFAESPTEIDAAERLIEAAAIRLEPERETAVIRRPPEGYDEDDPPPVVRRRASASVGENQPPSAVVEQPPPSFTGKLREVECLHGEALMHIESQGARRVFRITDPTSVVVTGSPDGAANFVCGAQNPALSIRIEYEEQGRIVTRIDFLNGG